jgi:hypothetical protein
VKRDDLGLTAVGCDFGATVGEFECPDCWDNETEVED